MDLNVAMKDVYEPVVYNIENVDAALMAVCVVNAIGVSWKELAQTVKDLPKSENTLTGFDDIANLERNCMTLPLSICINEMEHLEETQPADKENCLDTIRKDVYKLVVYDIDNVDVALMAVCVVNAIGMIWKELAQTVKDLPKYENTFDWL
ncbi:hypothetical protein LguiB_033015 [Lonicera macranthoides]